MKRWRRRVACWIPKTTNTHSDYVTLMFLHCNNCCTDAPQCYVIRTLPVLYGTVRLSVWRDYINHSLLTLKNMAFGPTVPLIVDAQGAFCAVESFRC